jgi:hypothetical protein
VEGVRRRQGQLECGAEEITQNATHNKRKCERGITICDRMTRSNILLGVLEENNENNSQCTN